MPFPLMPILIGAGIGGLSQAIQGGSLRNIVKGALFGGALGGIGAYAFGAIGGAAGAAGGAGGTGAAGVGLAGTAPTATFMQGAGSVAANKAAQIAANTAATAPLSTLQNVGIGTAAGSLGSSFAQSPPDMKQDLQDMSPYDESEYTAAYERARANLEGIGDRAVVPEQAAMQDQSVYNFQTPRYQLSQGGIVGVIPKFKVGGVNYLPSKSDHDEDNHMNYVRATGYVEDGSGNGDKDEDTMLAQLADGEFVSRADAVLGAGIMAGADPKDFKKMRNAGAQFFYKQQDSFKRVFDLVNNENTTS